MVITMKKIFAILISLLFVVSVFGMASLIATDCLDPTASPDLVKVGDLITVTSFCYPSSDPTIIADGNKPKGGAELVSRPEVGVAGKGLSSAEQTFTWVYRATAPGTIKFDFNSPTTTSGTTGYTGVSNPVTITSNSLPMLNFMKILGFGNESA